MEQNAKKQKPKTEKVEDATSSRPYHAARTSAGAGLAAFFALLCSYGVALNGSGGDPVPTLAITACSGAVSLVAYALLSRVGRVVLPNLPARRKRLLGFVAVLGCCCVLAGLLVGCMLAAWPAVSSNEMHAAVPTATLTGALPQRLAYALLQAAATALFEETLFRGILFPALASGLVERGEWSSTAARAVNASAWASGLIFGISHVSLAGADLSGAAAFAVVGIALKLASAMLFGYAMALLTARARSIVPAVFAHALYDAALAVPFAVSGATVASWTPTDPRAAAAFLVELGFCTLLAHLLRSRIESNRVPSL